MITFSQALVEWETGFIPDQNRPDTDIFIRKGKVSMGDTGIFFHLECLIHKEMLEDNTEEHLEALCAQALSFGLGKVLTGEAASGDTFTIMLPVVHDDKGGMAPVTEEEFQRLSGASDDKQEEVRFRYGHFLYYREADGKPKISKTCVGNKSETVCDDFDVFVNLNSPLIQNVINHVADLCKALDILGIAPAQTMAIKRALGELHHATPCYNRLQAEMQAVSAAPTGKKHMH